MNAPLLHVSRFIAALAAVAAVVLAVRLSDTRQLVRIERSRAETLAAQLSEIAALTPKRQTAIAQAPPEGAVTTDLLASLARCNIPQEAMVQQSTSAEEPVSIDGPAGQTYARRSVSITLTPIGLSDLGAFIADWKQSAPGWTISKIDLTHVGDEATANYSVALRLTATYLAKTPVENAAASPIRSHQSDSGASS